MVDWISVMGNAQTDTVQGRVNAGIVQELVSSS
jgi:hypothetical protein